MIYLYIIMLFVYIVLIYISFSRLTMALTIYLWLGSKVNLLPCQVYSHVRTHKPWQNKCTIFQTRENGVSRGITIIINYDNFFIIIIWYFTNIFLLYYFFLILHSHALLIYASMHIEVILLWERLPLIPLGIFSYIELNYHHFYQKNGDKW